MGQAANAAYTRTKCLDEAKNKAALCSTTAGEEASDEAEDALDALRIEIAKAERDYRDCKANAGG
jgi:vacuolar-type H+-ATPase subunit H